ncbi:hypothetical protein DUI87_08799 [Hirundo rustica rustica]|uniref:G-protein coupled receptors family 2 profile 1 domain-containing protein n=1 Tax=Hirundo rustica rustica TaxID=333673 RepID=A0A3M0KKD6_HIRRU|nr:hypothetical protein DUI87_08799 [Hirundo rustica rustica]
MADVPDEMTTHLPPASSQLPPAGAESCDPMEARDIMWSRTRQGQVAKQPCPLGSIGVATFRCLAPDGIWEPQGPDLSNCSSPWINHITQKLPFSQPLHGVVVTQGQDLHLGLIEAHTIEIGPLIQPVQILHIPCEGTQHDLVHDITPHFQLPVH